MATSKNRIRRRAIGIVRVSRVSGREGESFASPDEQRQRIEAECERDGLDLLDVIPEMDVSGGTPLEKREGRGRPSSASRLARRRSSWPRTSTGFVAA